MSSEIDWDDPAARYELVERVGVDEYNRLHREHLAASIVATVNGYGIRPVGSGRFGTIFMVNGTSRGFSTQEAAEAHARTLPAKAAQ